MKKAAFLGGVVVAQFHELAQRFPEIVVMAAVVAAVVATGGTAGPLFVPTLLGAGVGGVSAYAAGGDVLRGMAFGAAMGAAAGGLSTMLPGAGLTATQLGFWGSVGHGALSGATYGTAFGATMGYAGGKGDTDAILKGALYGAVAGAATGAVLGGVRFHTKDTLFVGFKKLEDIKPTMQISGESLSEVAKSAAGQIPFPVGVSTKEGVLSALSFNIFHSSLYASGGTLLMADAYLYYQYMKYQAGEFDQKVKINFEF